MEQQQPTPKSARLKIIIIIVAVLLVLSAGGLAARYIYLQFFAPAQSTAVVPDNLIGEDDTVSEKAPTEDSSPSGTISATDSGSIASRTEGTGGNGGASADKPVAVGLELYEGKPGDNQKFEATNMLPGDTETKYFCIKAYHDKDLELFFKANITEQTKSLADVLHIKVTHLETGKVLCDTSFSDMNGKEFSELLKTNGEKATTAYYQIDVSLDTAVGNEYQAAELKADFAWYVKDEGALTPPQTGDTFNLVLWGMLAVSSMLLILFLLLGKRKKEARHEQV